MQAADGAPAQGAEEPAVGGAPAVDGAAVGDGEWGLEGSHVDSLPHLTEGEGIGGILKARNADFVVEEVLLPGVPDGKEGFIVVAVEREGAATADVQKQLAALFGIKDPSKVAYAGLKDKDAVSLNPDPNTPIVAEFKVQKSRCEGEGFTATAHSCELDPAGGARRR